MASTVVQLQGVWWAYVWDQDAAKGLTCPEAAMRYEQVGSEEAGKAWCRKHQADVTTQYRARCAYDAGLPAANRSWLPYYRIWNADERVESSGLTDPDAMVTLWVEVHEQGG